MIALLLVGSASAFELTGNDWSWQNGPIDQPLYVQTSTFPAEFGTQAELLAGFEAGIEEWNGVGNLNLVGGGDLDLDPHESPGEYVVGYWDSEAPDSVVATAAMYGYDGMAYDCEIWFYDRNRWGDIEWGMTPGFFGADFTEVTTHEVGHCLGFGHSDDWSAVMRPATRGYRGLADDDRAAVLAAYPACVDGDGDGVSDCDHDCDDANAAIHPGAAEVCDGVDNDCDGAIDDTGAAVLTFGSASVTSAFRQDTSWMGVYDLQRDTTLVSFSQSIELPEDARISWFVLDGTTQEVVAQTELVDATTGFIDSPTLNVPLRAGHTYGIGIGVSKATKFHYGPPGPAIDGVVPLGNRWGAYVPGTLGGIHGTPLPYQRLVVGTADVDQDGVTAQCGDCDDRDAQVQACVDPPTPSPPTPPAPSTPPSSGGGCGSSSAFVALLDQLPAGLLARR